MEKTIKYFFVGISVVGCLLLIGAIVFSVMVTSAFGGFDKNYSVSELKSEYFSKEKEIADLINYYNQIKPNDYLVDIEFKDNKILNRLQITTLKDSSHQVIYQEWDVDIRDLQKDSLKSILNWDVNDIKGLKERLDKANCISVEDGEPIKIGFKRSGLGMYSFNIFQEIQTDRSAFKNRCEYVLVNRNLMLEYGGGAIGPQCFSKQELN
ncbi:hypothetical protein ASG01_07740 [Chryseobacterium sp. Leaf180]|uniref:hypothetical protein n=1 Tax=Chryseobacterium sp. Leaf180 TaxID=1736289 RepID=UPI0006FFE938|nr:hypothetical protein [Chryseobacterium sp. Leaf180]KQR93746.1 hypothetical protein ASG01_07740 [Chryseobacterium sp. Leaf180]